MINVKNTIIAILYYHGVSRLAGSANFLLIFGVLLFLGALVFFYRRNRANVKILGSPWYILAKQWGLEKQFGSSLDQSYWIDKMLRGT
jgi:LPXTG-motif cell wall-anchored protein